MDKRQLIELYFKARAESDFDSLREIFSDDVKIYNVNFPVYLGVEGIKNFCEDFQKRISHSTFEIIDIIEKCSLSMVEWSAVLMYKEGAQVAGMVVKTPFTFTLRGVNRFDFVNGKVSGLRVYHETTTALNLVKANS